jgi:hypothetical protein
MESISESNAAASNGPGFGNQEAFMTTPQADPMMDLAEAVSALFGDIGYAFVEDGQIGALADTLKAFLKTAGIPTDEARATAFYRAVAANQDTLPTQSTDVE